MSDHPVLPKMPSQHQLRAELEAGVSGERKKTLFDTTEVDE
jgi:hypothetical protein